MAIEDHYKQTYANTVRLMAQQRKSRLQPHVTVQPCSGVAANVADYFGSVTTRQKTERHEDLKFSDTPRHRRWLLPVELYSAELVDESDVMRILTDPKSSLAQAHVAGLERARDGLFYQAIFAAAATGEHPSSGTTAYVDTNDIPADLEATSTPSGLSPAKIIAAVGKFIDNEASSEDETPKIAINGKAWTDMFGQQTFTSGDYNADKPMKNAPKVIHYGGADLVVAPHALFTRNATTEWYLPIWMPSAVTMGIWDDIKVDVDKHPTKVSSYIIKVRQTCAVTRLEESKVSRIKIKYAA